MTLGATRVFDRGGGPVARAHRIVHGGVPDCYRVAPGASPEAKASVAIKLLRSGQAASARLLLDEALGGDGESGRVWFYWLLALLSGRTVPELSMRERARLAVARDVTGRLGPSAWAAGIDAILGLTEGDGALDGVEPGLREEIEEHLERVLDGRRRDECWQRGVERASAGRGGQARAARAWKFFEPDPALPRIRPARPAAVPAGLWTLAGVSGVLFAAGAATAGWLARDASALLALVIGLGGMGVALAGGAEWRFRAGRVRRRGRRLRPLGEGAPAGGFAEQIDRLYVRYARRYAGPAHAWHGEAYGRLCDLRDELVESYADPEPCWRKVRWLVRFQVRELRDRRPERPRLRELRMITVLGALLGVAGLTRAAGLLIVLLLPVAVAAVAVPVRIVAEYRRAAADKAEHDRRMTGYLFEFQRWQHLLGDRPDDLTMAYWQECDRRLLIDRALCADGLAWSDVQVCTAVTEPAPGGAIARVRHGPWRWSRYRLEIFLLTGEGVHRIAATLDHPRATCHDHDRTPARDPF